VVSAKIAIVLAGLIFFAFIAAGGKDILNDNGASFKKFTRELGSGITQRAKDITNKSGSNKSG